MAGKRKPRGPKCPVCGAVMSPKKEGGEPVCWFESSHADIIKLRVKGANKSGDARAGKSINKGRQPGKKKS